MKKIILAVSLSIAVITSCTRHKKSGDDVLFIADVNMENRLLNFETTLKENNAHGGQFYSSIDSVRQYGVGYSYILPDSLKTKNLTLYISAWIRESELPLEGAIAASVETTKGNVAWFTFDAKKITNYKVGEWVEIKDSVKYESTLFNYPHVDVRVFAIKHKGKDMMDVDDLKVKYKFSK